MAGSVNKVILVGNVGKDPEIRSTQGGMKIANLSIATSESWKDKSSGERKEKVEWHRVVCFNENLTKIIESYVTKGSKIYIEGALQTRKWTDKDGNDKYSTEIVLQGFNGTLTLLSSKADGGSARDDDDEQPRQQSKSAPASKSPPSKKHSQTILDDEIPF